MPHADVLIFIILLSIFGFIILGIIDNYTTGWAGVYTARTAHFCSFVLVWFLVIAMGLATWTALLIVILSEYGHCACG